MDSSSDEEPGNFVASQGLDEPPNLPSQPNDPSLHESDAHTNPSMTYSRGSVDSVNQDTSPQEVFASPGCRFGTEEVTYGQVRTTGPQPVEERRSNHVEGVPPPSAHTAAVGRPHGSRPLFRHLGITTRPPRTFRAVLGMEEPCYYASAPGEEVGGGTSPPLSGPSVIRIPQHHTRTLEALVQQGWTRSRPP